MKAKIKIAFDLDGVIVDKPPLIPKKLLDRIFRGHGGSSLRYRFPKSKLEQKIRKISHFYLLRPPIMKNNEFIKKMSKSGKYELYIISARYSFLKKETDTWLLKRGIESLFMKVYLNENDEQPNLFKENILEKIRPDIFVDDDILIINYLKRKEFNKHTKLYCYNKNQAEDSKEIITDISLIVAE